MALRGVTNNPFNLLSDSAPAPEPAKPASKPAAPPAAAAKPAAPAAGKAAAKAPAPSAAPAKAAPKGKAAGHAHKAAAAPAAAGAAPADAAAGGEKLTPKTRDHTKAPRAARGDKEAAYTTGGRRVFDKKSHSGTGRPPTENKKGGGGAHNWGKPGSEISEVIADGKEEEHHAEDKHAEKAPERPLTEEELAAKAEAELEARQITLDQYLAKQKKPTFALPPPRKANEGIEIEGKDEWNTYSKIEREPVADKKPAAAAAAAAAAPAAAVPAKKGEKKDEKKEAPVDPKSLLGFRSPPPNRGGDDDRRRGGRGGRGGAGGRGGRGGRGGGRGGHAAAPVHHAGGARADVSLDKSLFPALPSHGTAAPAHAAAAPTAPAPAAAPAAAAAAAAPAPAAAPAGKP